MIYVMRDTSITEQQKTAALQCRAHHKETELNSTVLRQLKVTFGGTSMSCSVDAIAPVAETRQIGKAVEKRLHLKT
jgi:hypothetical protein